MVLKVIINNMGNILIENKKVHDFIVEKDALVNDGRKISQKIDDIEKQISVFEGKERDITGKVDVGELKEMGEKLNAECLEKFELLQKVVKQIEDKRLSFVPKEMKDAHLKLLKDKEKLERDRNKIFLKVQKIKDRIIPIIQKEVKPLLAEYDDIETAKTKDGKVVISTFNHLTEFKRKYGK